MLGADHNICDLKLTCTYLELDKHSTALVYISKTKPFHILETYVQVCVGIYIIGKLINRRSGLADHADVTIKILAMWELDFSECK